MPPDTDARKDGDAATLDAPQPAAPISPIEGLAAEPPLSSRVRKRRWAPPLPRPLARYGEGVADFVSYLAAEDRRRRNASIVLAIALNILVLSLMAAYGRIRIWIPATPGESLSVVMVELPDAALLPELRDPELAPEPEVETPDPEIVEEPELEPEPAPNPVPEPEPEVAPPEPAPPVDLTPDPIFAPPSEDETGALIPEPDPGLEEEPGPLTITEEQGTEIEPAPPQPAVENPQSPAEEAPPLTEETPAPDTQSGLDVTVEEDPGEAAEIAPGEEDPPTGDDMFDEEPVFGPRAPLPSVDLPEGAISASPGASGVVAIFCPEHFDNEDKAAECAGRTEIRSGWRPGSSGEDWSGAVRLLRQARERGETGDDPEAVFGPEIARGLAERQRQQDLELMRRGVDDINNPASAGADNIERGLDRPTGPAPFEPTWTLPDDPNVSREELRKLEEDLDEAEAARRTDDG